MKKIGIHLGIMALIVGALAFGSLKYLDIYTKHDSELIDVENLEGISVEEALVQLEKAGLVGVVTDTVYKDGAKMLSVINQNPSAGLSVKPGRKVYLVINTNEVPMVEVPDLAQKTSLPQATNILLRRHLKVGKIIKKVDSSVKTKSDEPVLAQYKPGTTEAIKPGTKVERNSYIDLVIGISADYYASDSTSSENTVSDN
ncbi:MAG: PASTA domain-containing protein [Bacteroidia bacterium]